MAENVPDRREFLTGKVLGQAAREAANSVADSIVRHQDKIAPTTGDTLRLTAQAMACDFSVIMNGGERDAIWSASEALDLVHGIERRLTVYRDDSEVSRLNVVPCGEWTSISPELFDLLVTSRRISEATGGCFDITTDPIIRLWQRCRVEERIPDGDEVAVALASVGMRGFELSATDRSVRFLSRGVSINFGAIGKGHALDCVASALRQVDHPDFLLHGGKSSLVAQGAHTNCDGWPIGIGNPLFTNRRLGTITLSDQALSTSGSNIQFFRIQGQRFGHILDPRTGWPAQGAVSVTVLAPTAAEADALSTAFYVMSPEETAEFCRVHDRIGAILIPFPTGDRRVTPLVFGVDPGQICWDPDQVHSPASNS